MTFPGRPPPPEDDEVHEARFEGQVARASNLRVVGGNNPPLRQPDLLATIKRWHGGLRDRISGDIQPWRTLILVHADSGRTVQQFDVRTDENDLDLAIEIENEQFAHGQRLANNNGIIQNYTLDAYFGSRPDPQAHWTGDVHPQANVQSFGMSTRHMGARGTPQDFQQQDYRKREIETQVSYGLTQFAVTKITEQLDKALARIAMLEAREDSIREREQQLKQLELNHELELAREKRRARRQEVLLAGLMRYAPILVSRLDKKLFGLQQMSFEEKEQRGSAIIKNILSKLPNTPEGTAKFEQIAHLLELSEKDVQEIRDFGVMAWLEEQNKQLAREAELAEKGGFAALGSEIKNVFGDGKTPEKRQMGDGSK